MSIHNLLLIQNGLIKFTGKIDISALIVLCNSYFKSYLPFNEINLLSHNQDRFEIFRKGISEIQMFIMLKVSCPDIVLFQLWDIRYSEHFSWA